MLTNFGLQFLNLKKKKSRKAYFAEKFKNNGKKRTL